jgi:ribosomal protein S18 acetylase RimI-like enzyme
VRPATRFDAPTIERFGRLAADWRGTGYTGELPPEIARYVVGFGRSGDAGVVAEVGAAAVGAAWYRLLPASEPGYGFVAGDVPELSIAVVAEYRGLGLGRQLLETLLAHADANGVARISLSVALDNPAARLYERVGFRRVGVSGGAWTMLARTSAASRPA